MLGMKTIPIVTCVRKHVYGLIKYTTLCIKNNTFHHDIKRNCAFETEESEKKEGRDDNCESIYMFARRKTEKQLRFFRLNDKIKRQTKIVLVVLFQNRRQI